MRRSFVLALLFAMFLTGCAKMSDVENKPLARMLYHNVEIGAEIPPELYQMVAEVLAYVYSLQGRVN